MFAKETYNFKKPTNHSHPIGGGLDQWMPKLGIYFASLKANQQPSFLCVTLKIQVSFAKELYKRDDIWSPVLTKSAAIIPVCDILIIGLY